MLSAQSGLISCSNSHFGPISSYIQTWCFFSSKDHRKSDFIWLGGDGFIIGKSQNFLYKISQIRKHAWDFPGGPKVKNLPGHSGDVGSIPGQRAAMKDPKWRSKDPEYR